MSQFFSNEECVRLFPAVEHATVAALSNVDGLANVVAVIACGVLARGWVSDLLAEHGYATDWRDGPHGSASAVVPNAMAECIGNLSPVPPSPDVIRILYVKDDLQVVGAFTHAAEARCMMS